MFLWDSVPFAVRKPSIPPPVCYLDTFLEVSPKYETMEKKQHGAWVVVLVFPDNHQPKEVRNPRHPMSFFLVKPKGIPPFCVFKMYLSWRPPPNIGFCFGPHSFTTSLGSETPQSHSSFGQGAQLSGSNGMKAMRHFAGHLFLTEIIERHANKRRHGKPREGQ